MIPIENALVGVVAVETVSPLVRAFIYGVDHRAATLEEKVDAADLEIRIGPGVNRV